MQSKGAAIRELQGAGGGVGVLQYIIYIGYIICLHQLIVRFITLGSLQTMCSRTLELSCRLLSFSIELQRTLTTGLYPRPIEELIMTSRVIFFVLFFSAGLGLP